MRSFSDIPYELQRSIVPLSKLSRLSKEGLSASRTQIVREAPLVLPTKKEIWEYFNNSEYCKVIYYVSLIDVYLSDLGEDIDFSSHLFVHVEKEGETYSLAGMIDDGFGDMPLSKEQLDSLSLLVKSKQNWIEDTNLLSFQFLQVRDYSIIVEEYLQVDLESMFEIFKLRMGKDITSLSYSTFKETLTNEINRVDALSDKKKTYFILLAWAQSLNMYSDWFYEDINEYKLEEPIQELRDSLFKWLNG